MASDYTDRCAPLVLSPGPGDLGGLPADAHTNSVHSSLAGSGNSDSYLPRGSHAIWLVDRNPCCLSCF